LLEQTTQSLEVGVLLMTEAVVDRVPISSEWRMRGFTVVVSQGFSALLLGKATEMGTESSFLSEEKLDRTYGFVTSLENGECVSIRRSSSRRVALYRNRALNVSLTFDLNAIASFLLELRDLFASDSQIYGDLYSERLAISCTLREEPRL
jgi:two-component system, sensor histidine kinase and response regulator